MIQHEVSHLFGAYDYGLENLKDNVTGERLASIHSVMDKTKPKEDWDGFKVNPFGNIWFSHEWNPESVNITEINKINKSGGAYHYQT